MSQYSDILKGAIGREILKEEGEGDEQREVKNKQWIFVFFKAQTVK